MVANKTFGVNANSHASSAVATYDDDVDDDDEVDSCLRVLWTFGHIGVAALGRVGWLGGRTTYFCTNMQMVIVLILVATMHFEGLNVFGSELKA